MRKQTFGRLLSAVLCLSMLLGLLPAAASAVGGGSASVTFSSSDGESVKGTARTDIITSISAELNADQTGAVITKFNYVPGEDGTAKEIVIPSKLYTEEGKSGTEYTVTEIAANAFSGCELTDISFAPDSGIKTIGDRAFSSNQLTAIRDLPASIEKLGKECFRGCDLMTSADLTSLVNITEIPNECFRDCKSLANVTLPESTEGSDVKLTSINDSAFYECSKLGDIKIPKNITSIGNLAFRNCQAEMVIECGSHKPGAISGAPWGAISGLVIWDKNFGYNNDSPFIVGEDDGLIYGLKTAKIYKDGKSADPDGYTFENRDNDDYRYYAYINTQQTADKARSFSDTSSYSGTVNGFTIADKDGDDTQLQGEASMSEITYNSNTYKNPLKLNEHPQITFTAEENGTLVLITGDKPGANAETDPAASNISVNGTQYNLPENDKTVKAHILKIPVLKGTEYTIAQGSTGETELYLMELYYDAASKHYSSIELVEGDLSGEGVSTDFKMSVSIPREVQKMDPATKELIPGETITIKGIADGAFGSRPANHVLKYIDFTALADETDMTTIPEGAFWYCQDLAEVRNIPKSVTSIEKNAFRQCQDLTEITLPPELKTVGYWAFRQCTSLRTVIFDSTGYDEPGTDSPIESIDSGAFSRCPVLDKIYMQGVSDLSAIKGITDSEEGIDDEDKSSFPFSAYVADTYYKGTGGDPLIEHRQTVQAVNDPGTDDIDESLWYFNYKTKTVVYYMGKVPKTTDSDEGIVLTIPKKLSYKFDDDPAPTKVEITGVGQYDDNTELFYWDMYNTSKPQDQAKGKHIKQLVLNDQITHINDSAFYRVQVDEVNFKDAASLEEIAYRAFGAEEKTPLKINSKIEFPDSLKRIEDLAFSYREFTAQDKESVDFDGSSREVGLLTIPKFVESIASGAFNGVKGVGKIKIMQYNYKPTDPDYQTNETSYMASPDEVKSYAPFNIDASEYNSSTGKLYTIPIEYMDSDTPRYSDYILDDDPVNPTVTVQGKPAGAVDEDKGYSSVNAAVINLGVIMPYISAKIDTVSYDPAAADAPWWAEEASAEVKQEQWTGTGTKPDASATTGDATNYNGNLTYQIDVSNILGNGIAAFNTRYLPMASTSFKNDSWDVPVNIFHTQTYNGNGAEENVPAVSCGNGSTVKNSFVETYGVPIVGAGDMTKAGSVFLGWYVAEDGTELPESIDGKEITTKAAHDLIMADENFISADKPLADDETGIDENTYRLAMGTKDRTLYAVWAPNAYKPENNLPDYLDPGTITISKSVTSETGETPPEASFTFNVELTPESGSELSESYPYTGSAAAGSSAAAPADGSLALSDVTGSSNGSKSGTITLSKDQAVTISGIPLGTSYSITETPNLDFSGDPITGYTGTLSAENRSADAKFTNTYIGTPPRDYILTYDKNTSDTVRDMPNPETQRTSVPVTPITDAVPRREGYTFKGWAEKSSPEPEDTIYNTGDVYRFSDENPNVTLYAVWESNTPATSSPVPSASATSSPVPSASATSSPVPSASATSSPVPSASATSSPVPSAQATSSPAPSASATSSPVPSAQATSSPAPSAQATGSPAPGISPGGVAGAAHGSGGSSTTSVKVEKQWKDNNDAAKARPDSITVRVLNDGEVAAEHKISASNNWRYTFTGLARTKGGKAIAYTVEELPVDGYKANYIKSTTGYVIENEYVGGEQPSSPEPSKQPDPSPNPNGGAGDGSGNGSSDGSGSESNVPSLNHDDHYAYIIGYPDGGVHPDGQITRAEVATIFFRLLADESRADYWSKTNSYSDVNADNWYNNAVSTLTSAGIVKGYLDGSFRADAGVTRAEFAAIAARFDSGTYEGENQFSDIDGHWACEYINRAAQRGWISGYGDGTFRPDKPITRAEAMTLVNGVLDRHPENEQSLTPDMITWSDNDAREWYYLAVQEATNSHFWEHSGDVYERWTQLRETRDWKALEDKGANPSDAD